MCCAVQCVNVVNTYGQLIIHLIATEYTPEQVCKVRPLLTYCLCLANDKYNNVLVLCKNLM